MGTTLSCCRASPVTPTDTNQPHPRPLPVAPTDTNPMDTSTKQRSLPKIEFRVLILGRANAGKTTILQRVCDTTDSPTIYRQNSDGEREQVRPRAGGLTILPISSNATQATLNPSMGVSDKRCCLLSLLNS